MTEIIKILKKKNQLKNAVNVTLDAAPREREELEGETYLLGPDGLIVVLKNETVHKLWLLPSTQHLKLL